MKKTFLILILVCGLTSLYSQPLNPLSLTVEMRDNKMIAVDVYTPDTESSRPTILIQTPYNKYYYRFGLPLGIGSDLENSPYNFVIVDWRGFYASASAAVANYDRGLDGYDLIDWIVAQDWSDEQVGTWGPSALGVIQFQTAKHQHPNHVCAVPLVASPEFLYQSYYPNGVYRTEYVEQLDNLGYGLSTVLLANPYYNFTWQYIENQNYYPEDINVPMLMIGGWYDHATDDMLKYFEALCSESPSEVAEQHRILFGPWAHGGFGTSQVGTSTQGQLEFPEAEAWSDNKANEFFQYYLLDADNDWLGNNMKYTYFQMGEMEWESSEIWPPAGLTSTKYYLGDNANLLVTTPVGSDSHSSFDYDPRDPSPTVGSCTLTEELGQGPYDQAPEVESRDDILIFTSDILSQPVKHCGNVKVKLFVSSDKLDTDFAVRLCDVYPDGRSMILRDNIFRMRFREGFTQNDEIFMNTGAIYEIDIILENTCHTFLPNHKIRLDITSSNYPRFNNNMNSGGEMYVAGDTLIATNIIYHETSHASYIEFQTDQFSDISNLQATKPVNVYPNPITNNILHFNSALNIESVRLYNIYGCLIESYPKLKLEKAYIDISNCSSGIYFLEIKTSMGIEIEKLIIP
jgi:uncharacterized protein